MKLNFKIKNRFPYLIFALITACVLTAVNAYAIDVDLDGTVKDANCFWANGPGTELYVPSGKTCTLTGTNTAVNITGFTAYAVIVYDGGTLNIGDDNGTSLGVTGDILNMGTINVGTGNATGYTSLLSSGNNLIMRGNGILNANSNTGAGENRIVINGNIEVGTAADTVPAINLYDDNDIYNFGDIINYGQIRLYAGTLTADSIDIGTPTSVSDDARFRIDSGAAVVLDSYYLSGPNKTALSIGVSSGAGDALMTVYGSLTVPNYPADNVFIFIGSSTSNGAFLVGTAGVVDINETNTFASPPNGDPTNAIIVRSSGDYGLAVAGVMNTGMFLMNNGGSVNVDSKGANTGRLYAENHYQQASGLTVAAGDEMYITGTADIDGDSQIDGKLDVSDCTKVVNGVAESFDVGAAGIFETGDGSCPLTNVNPNDGLNVQGTDTNFTITNGASVAITGSYTNDDSATIDANGYFTATGNFYVQNGAVVALNDIDVGNNFEVGALYVDPELADATLDIEADTEIVVNGTVIIGNAVAAVGTGQLSLYGTINIPSSVSAKVQVNDGGYLRIYNTGLLQDDATSTQVFTVNDGGQINNDGAINITNQQFVMSAGSSVSVRDEGIIDSASTVTPGFDYNGGVLLIENGTSTITNGAMKFDDTIDIDTTGDMVIDGYLEGVDLIDFNGTGSKAQINPSGEMKVVTGTGTPVINIHRSLELYGKLNAADGAGTLNILGTNSPVVGSDGESGIDSYAYIHAGELNLQSGATIDVSNFTESYDPGGAETYAGSYGGQGGGSGTNTFGEVKYFTKPNYDTAVANPVGMFGFTSAGTPTYFGGGAVYIEVEKTLSLEGSIRANGQSTSASGAGAGSGGLIVIDHDIDQSEVLYEFKGNGTIEANGGDGTGGTNSYGGGGGRIVIKSILFDDPDDDETGSPHYQFTGAIRARGGVVNNGSTYAAAGTIVYLGDNNSPNDSLIVDQESRTLLGSVSTKITNSGDYVFDRVQGRNGADVSFQTDPATYPISCFDSGSSVKYSIAGYCVANPDKPDTLHVNNSVVGTQTGDEPWFGDPVLVGDLTPAFSVKARNPEVSSTVSKVRVQVTAVPSDFDNAANYRTCAACTWDSDITLSSATSINSRSVDFEYAGPALSVGNKYYIRVAFYNNAGTTLGLWTHRDMGNYYSFEINDALWIDPLCTGDAFNIEDYNNPGSNIRTQSGRRFGVGTCPIGIISGNSGNWEVLFSMNSSEGSNQAIAFNDLASNLGNNIDPINNTVSCEMTEAGTENVEEYGFNLSDVNVGAASTDTEGTCNTIDFDEPLYYHDVETYANQQRIISGTSMETDTFDMNLYVNISNATVPSVYTLDMFLVLTPIP